MIRSYLKSAYRNLLRNKSFSIINVAGLAIGLAVFLMIFEYVAFEWSANRFHKNYDRLYRTAVTNKQNGTAYYLPPGLSPMLKEKIPGVEAAVRVADGIGGGVISYTEPGKDLKSFREEQTLYVDGNFLEVFSFPLTDGTPSLKQPKTMAISENFAKKMFGKTNVAGTTVMVSDQFGNTSYTINAVFKNMPEQSDIKTDVLLSLHTLESAANRDDNEWADPNGLQSGFVNIYLLLNKDADAGKVATQFTDLFHSVSNDAKDDELALQPFSKLHLAPSFNYPYQTFGSLTFVVMLLAVAMLILFIAWINYINLSTVQALKRAKETGVRKVLGATRSQLTLQYLAETFLLTLAAAAIAFVLVQLLQNVFNGFTGKSLSLIVLNTGWFWTAVIAFIIGGSLLSGFYVAFVLSSFKPIATIRGKVGNVVKGLSLRKGLVVFQFSISIVFIIATIVLYLQLQFMQKERHGLNLTQLLVIKGPTISSDGQAEKNAGFKEALTRFPFIKKCAASNNVPGQGYNFSTAGITRLNPQKGDEKKNYKMFICDNNYFDTYDIKFTQGKSFTTEEANSGWRNAKKVLINEKAAAQLGFAANEDIAGKKILWEQEYEIAGVVKDYNHLSMRQAIDPMIFLPSVSFVYFTVQTDADDMPGKISTIQQLYRQYFPGNPFDYFFADETYNRQYHSEQQLGKVFIASALLAVIIACLGLFGLAAFTAQQRIKEIGIRKVLGASVASITQLLSKDFIKLVIISICIASPVAWWAMNKWLEDFAYRVDVSWWIFVVAGLLAVSIAWITVSFQAIKAAVSNPVKSLRTE
ncbi:MAG: ABC transporter permease [Chitinophagaceae bacterium]|nr:ABC transporter permease [Chitinophagaceae bacterium]